MIKGRKIDIRWPDGVRWIRLYKTPEAAQKAYQAWAVSMADGTWRKVRARLEARRVLQTPLFDSLKDRYMEDFVVPNNRSVITKRSRFSALSEHFGKMNVGRIRPQHIAGYMKARLQKVGKKTVNEDLLLLKHLFEWAITQELMTKNPAAGIRKLKISMRRQESRKRVAVTKDKDGRVSREVYRVARPRRISTAQIDQIMASLKDVNEAQYPIFLFIRETGCRLTEALTLKWEAIDYADGVVYLDQNKTEQDKAAPITELIAETLRSIPMLPGCPYVFYNSETQDRWKDVRKAWWKARKLAGHEWMEIHDLRRYRATELWEMGIPVQDVAEVLGHGSVSTTEKHYIGERRREAAKKVGDVLRKAN